MTSNEASSPQPQVTRARPVLIGAIVLVVIVVIVQGVLSSMSGTETVDAVLTHVDVSKRLAAAEILDPRKNLRTDMLGEVPPDCTITINGAPADLSDLQVGDDARITAIVLKKKRPSGARAVAKSIEVTR
jgi:hypothetical protein